MIDCLFVLCCILIVPLLMFSVIEILEPMCDNSMFSKIIHSLTILNISFIISVLLINYVFITKEIKLYNNISIKELVSSSGVNHYYIKTQERDYLINKNDVDMTLSNEYTFEVKTNIPKTKLLNLNGKVRTYYVLKLK